MSSSRAGRAPMCPVRPEHSTTDAKISEAKAAEGDEVEDELVKRADDLKRRIEHLEDKKHYNHLFTLLSGLDRCDSKWKITSDLKSNSFEISSLSSALSSSPSQAHLRIDFHSS